MCRSAWKDQSQAALDYELCALFMVGLCKGKWADKLQDTSETGNWQLLLEKVIQLEQHELDQFQAKKVDYKIASGKGDVSTYWLRKDDYEWSHCAQYVYQNNNMSSRL